MYYSHSDLRALHTQYETSKMAFSAWKQKFFEKCWAPQRGTYYEEKSNVIITSTGLKFIPSHTAEILPLDCCNKPAIPAIKNPEYYAPAPECFQEQEEKVNTMYAQVIASSGENQEREYLSRRLEKLQVKKTKELRKVFHLDGIKSPSTIGELKEYLKKGFLVIDREYGKQVDDFGIYSWKDIVSFVDPEHPADEAGHEKATDELKKAYQEAKDIIMVKDAIAGLEALQAFEAK